MKNGYYSLGKWISVMSRYFNVYLDRSFDFYKLTTVEVVMLASLFENDGVSQQDLVKGLMLDKSTIAKNIKMMIGKGYVTKKEDSEDRRAVKLYITEKALSIEEDFFSILEKWTGGLTLGFSEKEVLQLEDYLKRIMNNVCEIAEKSK